MPPILTIAHLTLCESRRRRIVLAALFCGLAFLAVFAAGVFVAHAQLQAQAPLQRQLALTMMTIVGLYGANFLSMLFAVLLPVDALSGDIDSGVMQTLASKPIRRSDIVLGKWLGHWVVIAAYLVLISVSVVTVTWLAGRTLRLNLFEALPLMLLQISFLLTLSIAGGTRFGTVTNGVVALGVFGVGFIGGWIEQIGTVVRVDSARMVGVAASLVSPADAMWRLAVHHLQPAVTRGLQLGPFSVASVPSALMVWWTLAMMACVLGYGVRSFGRRNL